MAGKRLLIHAAFPQSDAGEASARLVDLIRAGRLPISVRNLRIIPEGVSPLVGR